MPKRKRFLLGVISLLLIAAFLIDWAWHDRDRSR